VNAPPLKLEVMRLPHGEGLPLPAYHSSGAAGLDLFAAVPGGEALVIEPAERLLVGTGIAVALPQGYEGQIRPRSGLARDYGITVLNAPGTIDSDYRGEIMVLLINLGGRRFEIVRGARIAQLVVAPFVRADLAETFELSATARASGGFGSTGQIGRGSAAP